MAYQDMIEHLRLAVVQNAPTSGPRDPAIEKNQGTPRKSHITSVLFRTDDDANWNLMILGVEISRNGNQAVVLGVEQLLEQESHFESLRRAAHGRQKIALRPTAHRPPDEWLQLLPGYTHRERCPEMQVDDGEPMAARQVYVGDKDGRSNRIGCASSVGGISVLSW
jgi:hypothetical protein